VSLMFGFPRSLPGLTGIPLSTPTPTGAPISTEPTGGGWLMQFLSASHSSVILGGSRKGTTGSPTNWSVFKTLLGEGSLVSNQTRLPSASTITLGSDKTLWISPENIDCPDTPETELDNARMCPTRVSRRRSFREIALKDSSTKASGLFAPGSGIAIPLKRRICLGLTSLA